MGFYGLLGLLGIGLSAPVVVPVNPGPGPSGQDARRALRVPGRLVVNPTDLEAQFPYGGIEVGRATGCALQAKGEPYLVMHEGTGGVGDVLEAPHWYVFTANIRGWDDRALEWFAADYFTTGGYTGHALIEIPGDRQAGSSELDHALVLLFVPDDAIHSPAVLLYNAVPDLEGQALALSRQEELVLPVSFECMDDSEGRLMQVGRLRDLTL